VFVCEFCGAVYPVAHVREWGRDGHGDGYGPRPLCTNLVPNPFAPRVRETGETPLQVCGGPLTPRAAA
jgi:hypothetical protein